MPKLTDEQREFLDNPFVGVVTTVRADGSLHTTVVWVEQEDGDVAFTTLRSRAKGRQLERDPRVSMLVLDPGDTRRWVSVSGTAELSEEGADARVDRLTRKFLGVEEYPWRRPGGIWVSCIIRADRIEAAGI